VSTGARRLAIGGVLAALALASLGAGGCDSTASDTRDKRAGKKSKPKKERQKAELGDPITVTGNEGERVRVTAVDVLDPVRLGRYEQATKGTRVVGVTVKLSNVGDAAYADSPSNGAALIVSGNEQAQSAFLSSGSCSVDFGASARISPGSEQGGCIAYEVPQGKEPQLFRFALNTGSASQTGEWRLR